MNDVQFDTAVRNESVAASAAPFASLRERQVQAAAKRFAERSREREEAERLKQRGLFLQLDSPGRIAERAARKKGKPHETAELLKAVVEAAQTPAPSLAAAFERIIGSIDLLPIAYFERGARAARSVARVVTTDGHGHDVSYGTAFLVAPNVMLTNHHVLPDAEAAGLSHVEFNYAVGLDGQMEHIVVADIDPTRYLSDEHLDFALVGLADAASNDQRPVLPLIASSAKIINDEPVAIIQHPGAEPKQVALRNNQVIDLLPEFLHYKTDTKEGSSGSPVLNDQCEVVALHHAGVPQTDPNGTVTWVANEGIRISRIVSFLQGLKNLPPAVEQMVASVLKQQAIPRSGSHETAAAAAGTPGSSITLPAGSYVTDIHIQIRPSDGQASAGELARASSTHVFRDAAFDLDAPSAAATARREATPFAQQLEAGDVLLYNGRGVLSEGIKFFTRSDVSHCSLFMGGPDGGLIGEAVGAGVIRDTREKSFPGHNWVMVYRLRDKRSMEPVTARANFYLDQGLKYGYSQLVFLGILLLVKRVRPSGVLGRMVQAVAMAAAEALNRFIESGRDLMICSEFVYRAFSEAQGGPDNPYQLQIPGVARETMGRAGQAVEAGSILDQLQANPEQAQRGFNQAAESLRAGWPLNQQVLDEQVNELVAEYLAEQQYGRPARESAVQPFVLDERTAAAVSRFAINLAAVRHRMGGKSRQESLEAATQTAAGGGLPPALQSLFRSPADFVTPADLRYSPSLEQIGRVY
jgi:V8-like Glu-specific endopeptidase